VVLGLDGELDRAVQPAFVDECPPDQTCPNQFTTIAYKAPNLNVIIPMEDYVDVQVHVAFEQGGCVQMLQITNLPTWNGHSSPGGLDPTLWLAAADGTTDTFLADEDTVVLRGWCGRNSERVGFGEASGCVAPTPARKAR